MTQVRRLAAGYLVCGAVFLGLDAVWLTRMAHRLYAAELGSLISPTPRLGPAAAFYLIYLAGVVGFCVAPALQTRRPASAFVRGAAFGLVAYATYDLTNQATLAHWPMKVTLLDLSWGAFATAIAAGAAAIVVRPRRPAMT